MPIPKPKKNEEKNDFMERCIGNDTMKNEYQDNDQRVAICMSQWKNKEKKANEQDLERRYMPLSELRVIPEDSKKKIVGYAAVFNKLSEDLMGFKEQIEPGAFKKAIKKSDTRALWNHDPNVVLGRKSAGTLRLKEDDQGLKIEIDPPSWAGPYMESIERGDVKEMSFGFVVETDKWEIQNGENIRTIIAVRELPDVSPVTFPAYPETSVALRSMEAWQEETPEKNETVENREEQKPNPADETVKVAEVEQKANIRIRKLEINKKRMEV